MRTDSHRNALYFYGQSVGTVTLTPGPGDVSYASSPSFTPSGGVGYYCFGVTTRVAPSYQASSDTSKTDCFHAVGAPPTITSFNPTVGRPGNAVTIIGTNLSGATHVRFNGTDATIITNTATKIKDDGAAGGDDRQDRGRHPSGTVKSSSKFTVT